MQRVPDDILLEIASYLEAPHQVLPLSLTASTFISSRCTFRALVPALYAHLTLDGAAQCIRTLDMLYHHPSRARRVRSLCVRADSHERVPMRSPWIRRAPHDGYGVSAAVRRTATYLEILQRFSWEGEELPPYDDMWFALRVFCPSLKYIGACLGSMLPSPNSHLFDFADLHGFSLCFKSGFYWQYEGVTRDEAVPGYHRLWDMLIKRCPNLQELTLDGFAPHDPVDAHRLTRGRWPALRTLTLGDVVVDWHTHVNASVRRPFLAFLEAHRALADLRLLGHEQSVAAPALLTDVHADALARVEHFAGALEQLAGFQHKARLRTLAVPDAIVLREVTPLTVSGALGALHNLASLTIAFRVEHVSDNGGILRAIVAACPQLEQLDFTCACKPSFTLDTFSKTIRGLSKLRTLALRIVKSHAEDTLPECGARLARSNPRLRMFTLEFLARSVAPPTRAAPVRVVARATFELTADHHGLPVALRVAERRRRALWRAGTVVQHSVVEMRPAGYPGTRRAGLGLLLVEHSPAGEEARLLCFCGMLLVAALWGCWTF
ncbi:hypothetical protein FA95DRAFT_1520828 [Auriscalpium vulgare]|uniref:Uncharacterized protein n=1 Tax=Auriscalpium vulgare TaxID=40419 RepID=A0ACB8RQP9_9AGAM|nr:hypothetical protein FA95DRAFT_1520828 [Auriscalpium vulgare]